MLKCKECAIYNQKDGVCKATVILEGEYFELKTKPDDPCFWIINNIPIKEINNQRRKATNDFLS